VSRWAFWAVLAGAALVIFAPIRVGDLPGYDDAQYAHIGKGIALTGDWLTPSSNGGPTFEHPPLFMWIEAAMFRAFGLSDVVAKLPSAIAGFGCVLLVYWLARRMLGDELSALLAMLALATTIYFIKYTAHAMTDVPFTFFFLCAVCGYVLTESHERWWLAAGFFTACAQMTRGFAGLALPLIFAAHLLITRRKVSLAWAGAGLMIAFAPIAAWYAYLIHRHGEVFFAAHQGWMEREVYGALTPAWRRYTGLPEYVWMISKSYWPWLPAMIAGMVVACRNPKMRLFVIWVCGVLLLCAAARSRVLRYMLPAYPAFAILAALGIRAFFAERRIWTALKIALPALCVLAVVVAVKPPKTLHAEEIRPIASAVDAVDPVGQRVAFYDQGVPRYDEMNQLQWYGSRTLNLLLDTRELQNVLAAHRPAVMIVDEAAYRDWIQGRVEHRVVARSGRLICIRLGSI
jgi:4-amino-4-deoxy-L-arabinose transferase-like glycosyltransferase